MKIGKKHRFTSALLAVVFIINMLDIGFLKDGLVSLRAYAAASSYSVGFSWDISELEKAPEGGSSVKSGDTTTVKDASGNLLRNVTLDATKTQLTLDEHENENPILKTTFSFNLKKGIDAGNMEFTITGLDDLIRKGVLSLNMNDPNLVKTWKIEKVKGEDKYKFTNLVRVTSNNQTTFTWQFDSRAAVNGSDITLETSCRVIETETDPDTGDVTKTEVDLETNDITLKYTSAHDDSQVKIVCEELQYLDVNNLNTNYDWRSYLSRLGLEGFTEYSDYNHTAVDSSDYDAHYITQSNEQQYVSQRARGIKTSDYFIAVDRGSLNKEDILIVDSYGESVKLQEVEIDGKTLWGFYDFHNKGSIRPGESYSTTYRVGVKREAFNNGDEVKLTGHYLVTYDDESKVYDYKDTAAHKLSKDDEQPVGGEGCILYKHNTYETNRDWLASNGVYYYDHSKPYTAVNQLLFDSVFNDKVVTYTLRGDVPQAKDSTGKALEYDLVYEDGAPSVEQLADGTGRPLRYDEYDFTRVKVKKLVDGNTVGILDHVETDGTPVYKDASGFDYDVFVWSDDPESGYYNKWTEYGEGGNTSADSEVFLPAGIDKVRIVVRGLAIRSSVEAELDIKYHLDEELYSQIYIDSEHTKTADNKMYVNTNEGTRLRNEFTKSQYIGSYEICDEIKETATAYSLTWLRDSTTVIDSTVNMEELLYHNAWDELTAEEKAAAGEFRPSDYYLTTITAGGSIESDSVKGISHFAVASKLPEGVVPTEDWLESFRNTLQFSGLVQGTDEVLTAERILSDNAVTVYYDSEKGMIVADFLMDGYAVRSDNLTTFSFSYPASITLGRVEALGSAQSQFVTTTYVTVMDDNVKLSPAQYKTLIEPEENPISDTPASKTSASQRITALGSQKSNYADKKVASYYTDWSYESSAEVDGSNTDILDSATRRMTSEYTYNLGFNRLTTENEVVADPVMVDIVEGFRSSVWKGYVKSVSFKNGSYPALNGTEGYEPEVYYLLEEDSSVTAAAEDNEYAMAESTLANAIAYFQKYGEATGENTIPAEIVTNDLNNYSALKKKITTEWIKADKISNTLWEINHDEVYAVAVIFKGRYTVPDGYLQLGAQLNMRAPALENNESGTNNNRASYNECHAFAVGYDTNGDKLPMYSVSYKTLVILRHSVELMKVSSKDGRRLTGASFDILNSTNPSDVVTYYTFDKKRNKNEPAVMKDMEVDMGGSLILNLSPGIYYYKETKAPAGYVADDSLYRFRVVSDSDAVYYYTADLKTLQQLQQEYLVINDTEFTKYQSTAYAGKEFVSVSDVFHVFDSSGNIVSRFAEDSAGVYVYEKNDSSAVISDLSCSSGKITVSRLPAGSYTFGKTAGDKDAYSFSVADNSSVTLAVLKKSPLSDGLVYQVYEGSGSDITANDKLLTFEGDSGYYTLKDTDAASDEVIPGSDGGITITGLDPAKSYYLMIKKAPLGFRKSNKAVYSFTGISTLTGLYAAEQLDFSGRIVVEDDPIANACALFRKSDGTEGDNYDTALNSAVYNMYRVETDGSETKLYFVYSAASQQYLYLGSTGSDASTDALSSGTTAQGKGLIEVSGLPYGTYFLKEVTAPEGYQLAAENEYFRVTAATVSASGRLVFYDEEGKNGTDIMDLRDDEVESRIILTKKDYNDASKQLKDAAYSIYRLKKNTDAEVTEKDYLAAAQEAAVSAKGNTEAAGFKQYWGDEPLETKYTDASGQAEFEALPFGTYLLYEYRAPIGYTWNNDADKWSEYTVTDRNAVHSQIVVLDADTVTDNSRTVTVTETDDEGNETTRSRREYFAFYTDHSDDRQTGEARLLKSGSDGKALSDGSFSLYRVNFTDAEIAKKLGKEVSALTAEDISGAAEKLTADDVILTEHIVGGKPSDGDTVIRQGLQTSDDPSVGATATVSGLEWGVYYFYEVKAPSGYQQDSSPQLFTVGSGTVGTTIEVGMTDEKVYGKIWLYKQAKSTSGEGNDHLKLFGAQLTLYTKDNEPVYSYPGLRLTVGGTASEYGVKNITVDGKNKLIFTLIDGSKVTAVYEDTYTASGGITSVTGDEAFAAAHPGDLSKAGFRLTYYAASADKAQVYNDTIKKYRNITPSEAACLTANYVTADEGGQLCVRGLDWNSYYFRETVPPEGYGLAEDVIFTVNAYNCDNQFLKCEDPEASAAIIVDKEIPPDNTEYFDAYGEPTFMFRVTKLEQVTDGNYDLIRGEKNYRKTQDYYTLAIHMSSSTGSAMMNVPVGQYLIEELPVSRYVCTGISVVGAESENVQVKSVGADTRTSQYIFTHDSYSLYGNNFTAFCDLSGGSDEVLAFRVKYNNEIKRYDNFSQVTFADNYIPGQRYVTAIKPIYKPLVTVKDQSAPYTYEIDLSQAMANKDFETVLSFNTQDTENLTAADLVKLKFKGQLEGITGSTVTFDGTKLMITVPNPVSLAGQSVSVDVGYSKDFTASDEYNESNNDMVKGSLTLTFSEIQAQTRKRVIFKNDAANRSYFGDSAASGTTSYSQVFTRPAEGGDVSPAADSLTALTVDDKDYEFKYWYLLGSDGRPVFNANKPEELIQFADYAAVQKYIFDGTLPDGAAFKDADAYLRTPDRISSFTFQAEVIENPLPKAMLISGNQFNDKVRTYYYNLRGTTFKKIAETYGGNEYNQLRKALVKVVRADSMENINYTPVKVSVTDREEFPEEIYMWVSVCDDDDTKVQINWYSTESKILLNDSTADNSYFAGLMCSMTDITSLSDWDAQLAVNLNRTFAYCASLSDLSPIKDWNTSNVTSMRCTFGTDYNNNMNSENGIAATSITLNWDTSKVTDMREMFKNCRSLTTIDMPNLDMSNVIYVDRMFRSCDSLSDFSFLLNKGEPVIYGMDATFAGTKIGYVTTNDAIFSKWNISNLSYQSNGRTVNRPFDAANYKSNKVIQFNDGSYITSDGYLVKN